MSHPSSGDAEDARRLRALFDGVAHFVGLLAPDGTLLEANRASLQLAGTRREEVIGRPFWETPWWPREPERQQGLRDALHAAAAGVPFSFETHYVRADGARAVLDFSLTPVRDESGRVAFIIPEGRDITERRRAEEALRESEARLGGILDMAADAIVSVDEAQRITLYNKGAEAVFGYAPDEVIGRPLALLLPEYARDAHAGHVTGFADGPEPARFMNRRGRIAGRRRDGEIFPAEATISRLEIGGRRIFTAVLRDVTERERANDELVRAREGMEAILTSAAEGIIGIDRDGLVTFVNPAAARLLGYEEEDLVGRQLHGLVHHTRADGRAYPASECPTWASVHDGVAAACDDDVYWRADGTPMEVEYTSTPYQVRGRVEGAVVVFRDISERKRAEEALRALSFEDDLTGLHNRRGFLTFGAQALRQARRAHVSCLLLYVDVNDFKEVNDTHGHLAGDVALADVGRMMREVFRESDVLGRIGGDEFVVLAVGSGMTTLEVQRERLRQWLAARNAHPGTRFPLSISVGAAAFDPRAPVSLEELMNQADAALYEEKRKKG